MNKNILSLEKSLKRLRAEGDSGKLTEDEERDNWEVGFEVARELQNEKDLCNRMLRELFFVGVDGILRARSAYYRWRAGLPKLVKLAEGVGLENRCYGHNGRSRFAGHVRPSPSGWRALLSGGATGFTGYARSQEKREGYEADRQRVAEEHRGWRRGVRTMRFPEWDKAVASSA